MIGATRRWLRRKRGPIAIGIGVIGAGYLAGQYVIGKINEARERMTSERTARENLRRRFEQNQADCTFTVLGLLYTATENISEALPVEQLTQELQQKKSRRLSRKSIGEVSADSASVNGSPETEGGAAGGEESSSRRGSQAEGATSTNTEAQKPTKSRIQLWNELKIISLTRSFTLLYTLTLLTILTRIQLNLLGRRSYLASVVSLATPARQFTGISLEDHDEEAFGTSLYGGDDFETDKRYLAFSWWLLHRGWKDIMEAVKAAVTDVFGPISPREELSQDRLSELTREVRKKVEGATHEERMAKRWLPFMLPPRDQEEYVLKEAGIALDEPAKILADGFVLRTLLDETSDLIDSPPFCQIVIALNDEGFSSLIDRHCALEVFQGYRSTAFGVADQSDPSQPAALDASISTTASIQSSSSHAKVKFANILATISRQAHVIGNSTEPPNEYLATMEENVRELEAFAAVVYSNNLGLDEIQREELTRGGSPAEGSETGPAEAFSSAKIEELDPIPDEDEEGAEADNAAKAFDEIWGKATGSHSKFP